jgi:hypothetical protein
MKPIAPLALVIPLAAALAMPAAAQNRNDNNRPTINQLVAKDEARIAQLKANLRVTQEQESDWNRFEVALKDISKKRAERRIKLMDEWEKRDADKDKKALTHAEALRRHADALALRAEEIRAIADATEPFSEKLNNRQRQQVDQIIRTYVQSPLAPEDLRYGNF